MLLSEDAGVCQNDQKRTHHDEIENGGGNQTVHRKLGILAVLLAPKHCRDGSGTAENDGEDARQIKREEKVQNRKGEAGEQKHLTYGIENGESVFDPAEQTVAADQHTDEQQSDRRYRGGKTVQCILQKARERYGKYRAEDAENHGVYVRRQKDLPDDLPAVFAAASDEDLVVHAPDQKIHHRSVHKYRRKLTAGQKEAQKRDADKGSVADAGQIAYERTAAVIELSRQRNGDKKGQQTDNQRDDHRRQTRMQQSVLVRARKIDEQHRGEADVQKKRGQRIGNAFRDQSELYREVADTDHDHKKEKTVELHRKNHLF